MAAAKGEFDIWLNNKLLALNTDESVFGSYISGILDGDESIEEKTEALDGILSEILESDIPAVIKEILEKWSSCQPVKQQEEAASAEDVDTRLAKLMESQTLATTVQRQYTAEELKIREAILSHYSQMSDEENDEEDEGAVGCESENVLVRNTNAHDVAQASKERREQARLDSQKKKDKDKEDREKQKQLKEDKKEKRKTQKGERRR